MVTLAPSKVWSMPAVTVTVCDVNQFAGVKVRAPETVTRSAGDWELPPSPRPSPRGRGGVWEGEGAFCGGRGGVWEGEGALKIVGVIVTSPAGTVFSQTR